MTCCAVRARSVLNRYESRCVPVRSWTKTQKTGTRSAPPLYHWPLPLTVSTSRRPPPYQETFSAVRPEVVATTAAGAGRLAPFLRGRPLRLPITSGGGSYKLALG